MGRVFDTDIFRFSAVLLIGLVLSGCALTGHYRAATEERESLQVLTHAQTLGVCRGMTCEPTEEAFAFASLRKSDYAVGFFRQLYREAETKEGLLWAYIGLRELDQSYAQHFEQFRGRGGDSVSVWIGCDSLRVSLVEAITEVQAASPAYLVPYGL